MKKIVLLFTTLWLASQGLAADWKPVPGQFEMTRWANDVSPDKVLPEYPRPQMVRKDWLNLNGLWNYRVVARDDKQPASYPGDILVPFPIEAPLSGVGRMINAFPGRTYADSRLWYRREFETPAQWKGRRTLLHFGAELRAMIAGRFNHPSIVSWIVFNEGMGLQNPGGYKLDDEIRAFMRRMADIAAEDKTRAINAESGAPMGQYQGWNVLDIGLGQIMDAHCYGTTKCIAPTRERASVIGEYGYAKYLDSTQKYMPLVRNPGISGLVWTQLTDVENERNGLLSYDRSKFSEDPKQVAARNAEYAGKEHE